MSAEMERVDMSSEGILRFAKASGNVGDELGSGDMAINFGNLKSCNQVAVTTRRNPLPTTAISHLMLNVSMRECISQLKFIYYHSFSNCIHVNCRLVFFCMPLVLYTIAVYC